MYFWLSIIFSVVYFLSSKITFRNQANKINTLVRYPDIRVLNLLSSNWHILVNVLLNATTFKLCKWFQNECFNTFKKFKRSNMRSYHYFEIWRNLSNPLISNKQVSRPSMRIRFVLKMLSHSSKVRSLKFINLPFYWVT